MNQLTSQVYESDLPPMERLVLLVIADSGMNDLPSKTGISKWGIEYNIRRLVMDGYLVMHDGALCMPEAIR